MFYCAISKQLSKPGDKAIKVVTERRNREYHNEDGVLIGRGSEIVSEVTVTLEGLGRWCASHVEDTESFERYKVLKVAADLRRQQQLREGNVNNNG